jgi:hypothetical protein
LSLKRFARPIERNIKTCTWLIANKFASHSNWAKLCHSDLGQTVALFHNLIGRNERALKISVHWMGHKEMSKQKKRVPGSNRVARDIRSGWDSSCHSFASTSTNLTDRIFLLSFRLFLPMFRWDRIQWVLRKQKFSEIVIVWW